MAGSEAFPVYLRRADGTLSYTNAAMRALPEGSLACLAPPLDEAQWDRLRAGEAIAETNLTIQHADGRRAAYDLTRMGVSLEDGEIGELGVAHDITAYKEALAKLEDLVSERTAELRELTRSLELRVVDRAQADEALRQSEQRFRRIAQEVSDYIYTVEVRDGRPVRTTHGIACLAVTGYTTEEFAADPYLWLTMVHEQDQQLVRDQAAQVLKGLHAEPVEHRIVRKDGVVRWVRNTSVPNIAADDTVVSYDGVVTDITERKGAEAELRDSEMRYRRISQEMSDYIYSVQVRGGRALHTQHSVACVAVTGYTAGEFSDDPYLWVRMVHGDDQAAVAAHVKRVLAMRADADVPAVPPLEHRIVRKDGAVRWVRNTPVPHFDAEGALVSYDGLVVDITERRVAEMALEESEAKYRELVQNARSIILRVNLEGTITFVNQYALSFFGFETDGEMLGASLEVLFADEDGQRHAEEMVRYIHQHPDRYRNVETENQRRDGNRLWVAWTNTALYNNLEQPSGVMSVGTDITRRVRLEEELRALSHRDGLTQIANRRYFDEIIEQECLRAYRNQTPIALLMIDIDHFKEYNDHYGHQAGDDCLKAVAGALERVLKRPTDMVARYGGEEFVMVLPETSLSGADEVARRVAEAVTALAIPHERSGVANVVTVSQGVTSTHERTGDTTAPHGASPRLEPAALVAAADAALYEAKGAGRNQAVKRMPGQG